MITTNGPNSTTSGDPCHNEPFQHPASTGEPSLMLGTDDPNTVARKRGMQIGCNHGVAAIIPSTETTQSDPERRLFSMSELEHPPPEARRSWLLTPLLPSPYTQLSVVGAKPLPALRDSAEVLGEFKVESVTRLYKVPGLFAARAAVRENRSASSAVASDTGELERHHLVRERKETPPAFLKVDARRPSEPPRAQAQEQRYGGALLTSSLPCFGALGKCSAGISQLVDGVGDIKDDIRRKVRRGGVKGKRLAVLVVTRKGREE
ncbi:hypothetical protein H4582DRAFT_2058638 [Lactarius indigo]|nr:hypothetical protein H4582DRAFT_2058638 [Lactarius indigo]